MLAGGCERGRGNSGRYHLSVRMISRKDEGGSGGDSERASGRLGPRAQSPPKPRRDRFVVPPLREETNEERVRRPRVSLRVECTVTPAGCNFSRVAPWFPTTVSDPPLPLARSRSIGCTRGGLGTSYRLLSFEANAGEGRSGGGAAVSWWCTCRSGS